jgi:osmotically inducible protein OsmC
MDRTAKAHWQGNLVTGAGTLSSASGVLNNTPYSYKSRFEQGTGTNPEELLAAAHAGCFSMALSLILQNDGLVADSIDTTCTVSLNKTGDGFEITHSHLALRAKIPGASQEAFIRATNTAKENCPVSKLFDTEITLDAQLEV